MATSPIPLPLCKICSTQSVFFDRCDFHQNIKLHKGFHDQPIDPSGLMLDYFRCPQCGFLFTNFMDQWDAAQFATFVYNKDYPVLDGSYHGYRAGALANILYLGFREQLPQLSFVDYGGGLGITSVLLRAFGAGRAETYDPFAAQAKRPEGQFHIVTALEVLEHSINPKETVADLISLVEPDNGLIFFTTEFLPANIEAQRLGWWYVAPRVGHVSFYSQDGLERLFTPHGYRLIHVESHTHIAFKQYPLWAGDFLPRRYIPS